MREIVIFGAGGFAREVAWLIETINSRRNVWNLLGFIDENETNHNKVLNGYKVLGGIEWFKNRSKQINVVIAIGNPESKNKIVSKLSQFSSVSYPNLIHPDIKIHKSNYIGEGTIICAGSILTTNIKVGDHVIINLDCTIGHDAVFEDYSTILPSVNVSGYVTIRKGTMIGTGSAIIQETSIGKWTMVGAGAVVNKDIPDNVTAVGVPAKVIKKHK